MLKVKVVSLAKEGDLERILMEDPALIEEGLVAVAHQHPTDSGPLDILAVDSEGTLVVIELKNEASDIHLDQGLRYYDWCRQNISWIASAYAAKAKITPENSPRLMLIAPSFTDTVRRIAKYVDARLELIQFHVFETEKGEQALICNKIDFGQAPIPPEIPSIEKKMEYFQSDKVKELFLAVLAELKAKQVEVKPINELWISFWYRGKRFMYAAPRKTFFVVEILKTDGTWSERLRVSTRNEWDQTFGRFVAKYMQYLDEAK